MTPTHRGWAERRCKTCGVAFRKPLSKISAATPANYCSRSCARAARRGLKINDTPRDEIARLYRDEGWPITRIGAHLGLSLSTISYQLARAGVKTRPPTGANLLTPETLAKKDAGRLRGERHPHFRPMPTEQAVDAYLAGVGTAAIAARLGVSVVLVQARLREAGILLRPSEFGRRQLANDGHPVRSGWERMVDDWLSAHGVEHSVEPAVPFAPAPWRADFFARGHYVEVWGVRGRRDYEAKRAAKEAHYAQHGLPHIGISPPALSRQDFSALMVLLV